MFLLSPWNLRSLAFKGFPFQVLPLATWERGWKRKNYFSMPYNTKLMEISHIIKLKKIPFSWHNTMALEWSRDHICSLKCLWSKKITRPRCGLNRALAHGYSHCPTALLLLFLSLRERSGREMWHSYRRHLLLLNNRLSLRETWLGTRCYVIKVWYWEKRQ